MLKKKMWKWFQFKLHISKGIFVLKFFRMTFTSRSTLDIVVDVKCMKHKADSWSCSHFQNKLQETERFGVCVQIHCLCFQNHITLLRSGGRSDEHWGQCGFAIEWLVRGRSHLRHWWPIRNQLSVVKWTDTGLMTIGRIPSVFDL